MPAKTAPKPRLKNLDDLFLLAGGADTAEAAEAPAEGQPPAKRRQVSLPIHRLIPFKGHPFRLYEGERLADMVESIRQHGVLVPILVREAGDAFEILSGHNRVNAAKLAGLEDVPCIVLEGVSDADAWIYVIETNLMQRSFADMHHSEKAAVIAAHHSKLFSQGKRNDILAELRLLENPQGSGEPADSPAAEQPQKQGAREALAKEYGLAPCRIAQYLRVFRLIGPLKTRLDDGQFAVTTAVSLSFLTEGEQGLLEGCIAGNGCKLDGKKAGLLRERSEQGGLDGESIAVILSGQSAEKAGRAASVKVSQQVYSRYFRPDQPAKEVQAIVEKALALYFSQSA